MNACITFSVFLLILFTACPIHGQESQRRLFDFGSSIQRQWQIVNDDVMGGRSTSSVEILEEGQMRFSGTLSLKNNGGFASVRSTPRSLDLKSGDKIRIRVKGDGRTYAFNLYIPNNRRAFSFRQEFTTRDGEWLTLDLPLENFRARSYGRSVNQRLNPGNIESVGVLLGDKTEGEFEILLDEIKVIRGEAR